MDKADILTYIKITLVTIGGLLCNLLGGWDIMLEALIFLTVIDYVSGIIKAFMRKSEKTEQGGFASRAMYEGGFRKILIFGIVAVACIADRVISPGSSMIRSGAIIYYLGSEGLSIAENVIMCGVPVPEKLKEVLSSLNTVASDKDK